MAHNIFDLFMNKVTYRHQTESASTMTMTRFSFHLISRSVS